jgi:hypothetical protein
MIFNETITSSDKLIYEFILSILILIITHLVYPNKGIFSPSERLSFLTNQNDKTSDSKV